jgi:2-keto-4-pentenoate hydratase
VSEAAVRAGTAAMLLRRSKQLAAGAEPLGWKVGFNLPQVRERLALDAPLAGFLTSDGLLEDGGEFATGGAPAIAEPEVAVELGPDGRSIAALLPALEVTDPPDLTLGVEPILAGNIFHRAVAFGPRVEVREPGAARVVVNDEERERVPAERTAAHLEAMVGAVASRLTAAGERLRPGERIITGVIASPPRVVAGDRVRLELERLGAVEVAFS